MKIVIEKNFVIIVGVLDKYKHSLYLFTSRQFTSINCHFYIFLLYLDINFITVFSAHLIMSVINFMFSVLPPNQC